MKKDRNLDTTDKNILRVLSQYEHLTPTQVWYELGTVSEKEIERRLESLRAKRFVESVTAEEANRRSLPKRYRLKRGIKK